MIEFLPVDKYFLVYLRINKSIAGKLYRCENRKHGMAWYYDASECETLLDADTLRAVYEAAADKLDELNGVSDESRG